MKSWILVALMAVGASVYAQDVLYFKNGQQQTGQVLTVEPQTVSYKKAENPTGPTYVVPKSELAKIMYANGSQDVWDVQPNPSASNTMYSNPSSVVVVPAPAPVAVTPVVVYGRWHGGWHRGFHGRCHSWRRW